MRRSGVMALCAVAALLICAIGAGSAFAEAPEFGRCVKKAKAEGSGYSNSGCTTKVESGAKYVWESGPGASPKFSSEAREVEPTEAKRCLTWHEEIKKGNTKHAAELLEKWKYTAVQCEKAVKAHICYDWLVRGEPKEAEEEGFSKEECEGPAKEWPEAYLREAVLLETVTGDKVECEGVTASGEYSSTNTKQVVGVVARFTNCVAIFGELSLKCTSTGASVGEIVTNALTGELGVIKAESNPEGNQVGLSLAASVGTVITEFECGPILGGYIKNTVTGSVIHPLTTNKMLLEENEKFTQHKGKQSPENFQGGPLDVLETSVGGGSPVQSGEALLTTLVNSEKMEVNTVV